MNQFMQEAINLSRKNIDEQCGWPFWAVIVKNWEIVWRWYNHVVKNNDPTAHWEVMAIRDACKNLWSFDLSGCEIYTSCEPCPMCLGAIYWARIKKIYYWNTQKEADEIWFDDGNFYKELALPIWKRSVPEEQIMFDEAKKIFDEWKETVKDIKY